MSSSTTRGLPAPIVQAIVVAALSAAIGWATWATAQSWKHETRIAVAEKEAEGVSKKLDELAQEHKEFRKEVNDKLDRLIRRGR